MKLWLVFFLAWTFSVTGRAAGLNDPNEVDIVRVSGKSGQVFLYLVLSESIEPDDKLRMLVSKLNVYARYASSDELYRDEPKANRSMPVVLVVITAGEHSAAEFRSLAALSEAFANRGFQLDVIRESSLDEHLRGSSSTAPNPSIERTLPGKPVSASHVKR